MNRCSLLQLLLAIHTAYGSHFRGGSMSWKPIENNQIELSYRVGFKYDHIEPGFDPCTPEAQRDRTELSTRGEFTCDRCSGDDVEKDMTWICDEYDVHEDTTMGHNVFVYNIPEGHQQFDISYEDCCWVPLLSPVNRDGSSRGWKMMTSVDVKPRIDGGGINSSPVSALIPVEKFYKGCEYKLRIPVSDPDNDAIRCRYADTEKNECPARALTKACGPATDGLVINKKDCTLYFDTTGIGEGYHAVNVVIEDFVKPVKRKSKPLSKVSLLFLLYVDVESETCPKPTIVDPPSCMAVRPGERLELVIRADPGDVSYPIHKIRTQKPYGITQSQLENDPDVTGRKRVTLQWYPTSDEIGEHHVCYSALDSGSFTSGMSCTFVYVDDTPLRPDEESRPGVETGITAGEPWVITFNKKIQRPQTSALIKIVEPTSGNVIFEIASTDRSLIYRRDTVMFIPTRDQLFKGITASQIDFELQLEEGVAIPDNGCGGSAAVEWPIRVHDIEKPSTPAPPVVECSGSTVEIIVPNEIAPVGDACVLILRHGAIPYGRDNLVAPYSLCCDKGCVTEAQCDLNRKYFGYRNAPSDTVDYHDWAAVSGPSSPGEPTGPDWGIKANPGDCYLLFQTNVADVGTNALLISPCYTKSMTVEDPTLGFAYHMYGMNIGRLNGYLRPGCVEPEYVITGPDEWELVFDIAGNQGKRWINGRYTLNIIADNFQVIFEGVSGNGTLDDIALDEIAIQGVECFEDNRFLCDGSNCIQNSGICDGIDDCIDRADEIDCVNCTRSHEFLCNNRRCIDTSLTCDLKDDCGDGTDEINCTGSSTLTPPSAHSLTRASNPASDSSSPTTIQPTSVEASDTAVIVTSTVFTSEKNTLTARPMTSSKVTTILSAVFGCLLFVVIIFNITYILWKRTHRESSSNAGTPPEVPVYETRISDQIPAAQGTTSTVMTRDSGDEIPLSNTGYQDVTIPTPESTYQGLYNDIAHIREEVY